MKRADLWMIILFAGLATATARGDGGRVQMHERAGPFVVTLFSVPDNLVAGPADLSVGVEDAETGEMIDDAEISLSLSLLDSGSANPIMVTLTRGASTNGIMQAAQVTFTSAGHWHVALVVTHQGMRGRCSTNVDVGTPHRQAYEVWFAGVTPFLVALLFIVHQSRKRRWTAQRTKIVDMATSST
jgi:hypothetical protein